MVNWLVWKTKSETAVEIWNEFFDSLYSLTSAVDLKPLYIFSPE